MTIPQISNNYAVATGSSPDDAAIPVISTVSPTSASIHYPIGKRWINKTSNLEFVLTSFTSGVNGVTATWTSSASAGTLSTLSDDSSTVVTPSAGNIQLAGTAGQIATTAGSAEITFSLPSTMVVPGSLEVTGLLTCDASALVKTAGTALNLATDTDTAAVNIATAGARTTTIGDTTGASGTVQRVGTGNYSLDGAATSTYTFGPSTTSGTINFGGTGANTGTMTIAGGTGAQTVNIANSTGGKTVAIASGAGVNTVTLGSTNTTSATTVHAGTGGVALSAAGAVSMVPATGSVAGTSLTLSSRVGVATFTGLTTAAAATQALTITNTTVTATSGVFASVYNLNASTNGAAVAIDGLVIAANTIILTYKNNGSGALGAGDNVLVSFWVIS